MDRGVPQIIRAYLDSSINPPLFTIETDEQAECRVSTESHFEVFENGNLMINGLIKTIHTDTANGFHLSLQGYH